MKTEDSTDITSLGLWGTGGYVLEKPDSFSNHISQQQTSRWVILMFFFCIMHDMLCVSNKWNAVENNFPFGDNKVNQSIGDHDHGGTGMRIFLTNFSLNFWKWLHEIYNTVQVVFGYITTISHIVPLRQDWEHCLTNTPPILVPKEKQQSRPTDRAPWRQSNGAHLTCQACDTGSG